MANPNGNPNYDLKNAPKPGPTSEEGKNRVKQAVAIANSRSGRYSKYLNSMKVCNRCPLRPKEVILEDGARRIMPGLCGYYQQDKKSCELSYNDFKIRLRDFNNKEPIELQKEMIIRSIERAEINEMIELLKEGKPGMMTKEFYEQAMKYNEGLIKLTQKYEPLSRLDITQQWLRQMFPLDDSVEENKEEKEKN